MKLQTTTGRKGDGSSAAAAVSLRLTRGTETMRSSAAVLVMALLYVGLVSGGNPDAKRLYDDLLSNYNKLVRPVVNVSEAVTVRLKLKLSQLIDVVSERVMMVQPIVRTVALWVYQLCSGAHLLAVFALVSRPVYITAYVLARKYEMYAFFSYRKLILLGEQPL